jgi:hypothetical protein
MTPEATVVYYTSNREHEAFEAQVRARLVAAVGGRWPIISVSHKPIDLGQNLCVGDLDACDANAIRQLSLGIEAAKTPYIFSAEADCLYPRTYFDWLPPSDRHVFRYTNVWILSKWQSAHHGPGYLYKGGSECAQVAGREYWLKCIQRCLRGRSLWSTAKEPAPGLVFHRGFRVRWGEPAVVNVKTREGLRKYTRTISMALPELALPYWGPSSELRAALFPEAPG